MRIYGEYKSKKEKEKDRELVMDHRKITLFVALSSPPVLISGWTRTNTRCNNMLGFMIKGCSNQRDFLSG